MAVLVLEATADGETQASGGTRNGDVHAEAVGDFPRLAVCDRHLRRFIRSTVLRRGDAAIRRARALGIDRMELRAGRVIPPQINRVQKWNFLVVREGLLLQRRALP